MQQIDDRQQEIHKENTSWKRRIKTDEQYQMWHVGVQEELDELNQEKRDLRSNYSLWKVL